MKKDRTLKKKGEKGSSSSCAGKEVPLRPRLEQKVLKGKQGQ